MPQRRKWTKYTKGVKSIAKESQIEQRKAQQALMFLGEKWDGTVKGRMVYNGNPTREWLSSEDSASPTAALKSIMLRAVIDAHEERKVMTCRIPNAFIQMLMVEDRDKRVMMKVTGVLVDMLVELNPELYGPYVVYEKSEQKSTMRTSDESHLQNVRSYPIMV
jgi:hypothetical protein